MTYKKKVILPLLTRIAQAALLSLLLSSCSMMTDDRSDCPTCDNTLHVELSYTYNMHGELAPSQLRQATVYVVDPATGAVVDAMTATATAVAVPGASSAGTPAATRTPASTTWAFNFSELPAGTYRLFATAAAPAGAAPTSPTSSVSGGSTAGVPTPFSALTFPLLPAQPAAALDTVWNTLTPTTVTLDGESPVSATIPLMRLTKNLSILLIQTEHPDDLLADDYDVSITTPDATFAYDNSPVAPLAPTSYTYTPYAQWTTESEPDNQHAAHYELSFPRLLTHDDATQNARLVITHREDQQRVLDIDLIYYLALARTYAGLRYPLQEYLDREHDYRLDVVLAGNEWQYMEIYINVMAWSHRIFNTKL